MNTKNIVLGVFDLITKPVCSEVLSTIVRELGEYQERQSERFIPEGMHTGWNRAGYRTRNVYEDGHKGARCQLSNTPKEGYKRIPGNFITSGCGATACEKQIWNPRYRFTILEFGFRLAPLIIGTVASDKIQNKKSTLQPLRAKTDYTFANDEIDNNKRFSSLTIFPVEYNTRNTSIESEEELFFPSQDVA